MGQGLQGAEIVRPCTFQTVNGEADYTTTTNLLPFSSDNEADGNKPIQVGGASFGSFYVASVSGATGTVSLYASFETNAANSGYFPIYDQYGVALTYSSLSAGRWYELPAAAMSVPYLWLDCANAVTIRVLPYLKG